jgi:hypothetical protein
VKERGEQHRVVALALGEAAPPGLSVDKARDALTEAQRQHRLAREAIATLESGLRDLAPQLTFAGARVRDAVVAVFEDEGAVKQLLLRCDRLARAGNWSISGTEIFEVYYAVSEECARSDHQ